MIKLCIFDLDGTVLDTVASIAHFLNTVLVHHGIEPYPVADYNYLAGAGAGPLVHEALARRGQDTPELFQSVMEEYIPLYRDNVAYKTTIFDGLKEQLDRLKAAGISLAIVSNKPDSQAQAVVRATYGEGYFDYVTGQKPGGPLKPDITEVLGAMARFGVTSDECLYFGDTSIDMITGKRSGIYTVGVLWGFRGEDELRENGADFLLRLPTELADFVLNSK